MKTRHTTNRPAQNNASGFSMIDVLVSIIVMATALLGLAVLQSSLTRNTADSRARSQLAQYADGLIDKSRQTGYSAIPIGTSTVTAASGATFSQAALDVQNAAGISNLQAVTTVGEFTYADPNVRGANSNCTGQFIPSNSSTNTYSCPVGNGTPSQYKNVQVALTWTDATGTSRTLTENTVVSPLELDTGGGLQNASAGSTGITTPIVREPSPVVPGVIPIAIGANTDTAATNPRPELSSVQNATSYNVLTYKDLTTQVQIQQRVETVIAGCSCQYGRQITTGVFAPAWRPTFWDGTKYAEPTPAYTSPAGEDPTVAQATINNAGTGFSAGQSPLCMQCCRDHHDYANDELNLNKTAASPNDYITDTILYDPFRIAAGDTAHTHYRWSGTPASFTTVPITDTTHPYMESCRMIRVNGLWRVATDLNAEQVGLVATASQAANGIPSAPASTMAATSWIPDANAEVLYQNFVKDYLDQKVAQNGTPVAPTLYHNEGLDAPTTLAFDGGTLGFAEYMHARGLYLDHLEPAAVNKIQDAATHCAAGSTTIDCVLPYIPFTSINLTELAIWAPPTGSGLQGVLQAVNGSGVLGDFAVNNTPPIRGKITATNGRGNNDNILVKMTGSNSGIAGGVPGVTGQQSIDPTDSTVVAHWSGDPSLGTPPPVYTDQQAFRVTGANGKVGSLFTTNITGLPQTSDSITNNDPLLAWYTTDLSDGNDCTTSYDLTNFDPNPYTCQTDLTLTQGSTLGTDLQIWVQKYNIIKNKIENNPCDSTAPQVTHSYCEYSAVSEVDLGGVALSPQPTIDNSTNNGKVSEISKFTVPLVPTNGSITVKFSFTSEVGATPQACDTSTTPATFPGFNPAPCL